MADPEIDQRVVNRELTLCPNLAENFDVDELIQTCPECEGFYFSAVGCMNKCILSGEEPTKPCHHYELVFTDGAC